MGDVSRLSKATQTVGVQSDDLHAWQKVQINVPSSMADFLRMSACTRDRLPHRIEQPPPMKSLARGPWWEASEYLATQALFDLSGSVWKLKARLEQLMDD